MARSLKPFPWLPRTEALPVSAIPQVTFAGSHSVEMNGERITLRHFGPAHTAGDAFVIFEKARVVHVGDTFLGGGRTAVAAPISGGSFEGLERALDALPAELAPDTIVVSGHGSLGEVWTLEEVRQYRDLLRAALQWVAQVRSVGEASDEDFANARLAGWEEWARGGASAEKLLRAVWNAG